MRKPVGLVERTLYTASWLVARPEFIAVWLAIKTVSDWTAWREDQEGIPGRAIFNVVLIGSGLSILWASVGAFVVTCLQNGDLADALACVAALAAGNFILFCLYPPKAKLSKAPPRQPT